ncbi:MAG: quinolinate synthase NadA [Candidatus Marinimicrobia bacterium]|nr:quinolinate synthase NadA [Candidatus Neomarinimicrobiota bacterium]
MNELQQQILELKRTKNAVILAHSYQIPEIKQIADFTGDSYQLAVQAKNTDAEIIVFCGVHFMAETAKIINPKRTVLLPSLDAGCALADEITAEQLRNWKAKFPSAPVVLYINSTAAAKAEADVVCTSSNARKIVQSLPNHQILMAPDKNLSNVIAQELPEKDIIAWDGVCPVHQDITAEILESVMAKYPTAEVVVHPECRPEVCKNADAVLSTSGMIDYVEQSNATEFIIGTEQGLIDTLIEKFPQKRFFPTHEPKSCDESCVCPYMKSNNLDNVLLALKNMQHEIVVEESVRVGAKRSIDRMLEITI